MKYTVFSTSLCLCIFCLILLSRNSSAADYRYEACTPRVCGNVQNIKFPFYIEGLQESYCGQPGFQLNCSKHGYPTISFSGNDYIVENISYPSRSIRVYNAAVSSTSKGRCLSQISNTTTPVSEFRYVNETAALHLLSNCTEPLSKDLLQYKFVCQGEKSNNLDLAIWDKDENLQNGLKSCKKNVVVPVEVYGDEEERIGMRNYEEILRRGFALNWLTGYNCTRCERYGGRCGFNTTTYSARCFCPDGPGEQQCKSESRRQRKVPECIGDALSCAYIPFAFVREVWQNSKHSAVFVFSIRLTNNPPVFFCLPVGFINKFNCFFCCKTIEIITTI